MFCLLQHRYTRQDSISSHSSSSGRQESSETHSSINGEVPRRGSHSSQSTQSDNLPFAPLPRSIARRDSFEMPQRTIIDSPRPQRSRSLHKTTSDSSMTGPHGRPGHHHPPMGPDSFSFHRQGSVDNRSRQVGVAEAHIRQSSLGDSPSRQLAYGDAPSTPRKSSLQELGTQTSQFAVEAFPASVVYVRPDTYHQEVPGSVRVYSPDLRSSREEYLAFSQDIAGQQGSGSPLPGVHKSKPRAFPRTNPTCRREGSTSFKRDGNSAGLPGYDVPFLQQDPSLFSSTGSQSSQSYSDTTDSYNYTRHERSDSDTSHSSNRLISFRPERSPMDNQIMYSRMRELSDSQSSQGSSRNMSDTHSSQGSLRNLQDSAVSVQDSISSKSAGGGSDHDLTCQERTDSRLSQSAANMNICTPVNSSVNHDGEPDYANIPPRTTYLGKATNGFQSASPIDSSLGLSKQEVQLRPHYPDYESKKLMS